MYSNKIHMNDSLVGVSFSVVTDTVAKRIYQYIIDRISYTVGVVMEWYK